MGKCQSHNGFRQGHDRSGTSLSKSNGELSYSMTNARISKKTNLNDISKYYQFGKILGKGSFGLVREAVKISTSDKFAIKTIWKWQFENKKLDFFAQEIEILVMIDHENIIKCHEVYEDNNCIHFVFDLIDGGDLFDYLMSCPNCVIPEERAVDFAYQIIDALQYLHRQNIMHRDIKPENFLICHSNEGKMKIMLIDFGFATFITEDNKLQEAVGSLSYIAPEMLRGENYDTKVDMWAAGVVIYNMLAGRQPFSGNTEQEIIESILTTEPSYDYESFQKNRDAKELCRSLLVKDPRNRVSAEQAKTFPWMNLSCHMGATITIKFEPKQDNIKSILNILNQCSNVKSEVWGILLAYLNIETAANIKNGLLSNANEDKKQDGALQGKDSITYEQFLNMIIAQPEVSPLLIEKINGILKNKLQICQKNLINFKEFHDSFLKCKQILVKEQVWNIFKNNDTKRVGYLTYDQACQAFSSQVQNFESETMKEIMRMLALDNKNKIVFEDFYKIWDKFQSNSMQIKTSQKTTLK